MEYKTIPWIDSQITHELDFFFFVKANKKNSNMLEISMYQKESNTQIATIHVGKILTLAELTSLF